jgi:hypothetical protein
MKRNCVAYDYLFLLWLLVVALRTEYFKLVEWKLLILLCTVGIMNHLRHKTVHDISSVTSHVIILGFMFHVVSHLS